MAVASDASDRRRTISVGSGEHVVEGGDELGGKLGDDGVSGPLESGASVDPADFFRVRGLAAECGAHHSHTAGNPISQRLNSGANAPRFSVEAVDDSEVCPCTNAA